MEKIVLMCLLLGAIGILSEILPTLQRRRPLDASDVRGARGLIEIE
jgi:hypothetical protein